eukprot:1178003-Prorocentrum_minimum.AAC.4
MNSTRTRTLNLSQTTVSQQRAFQRFFPSTPQKGVAGSSATCVEVRVDANVQGDLTMFFVVTAAMSSYGLFAPVAGSHQDLRLVRTYSQPAPSSGLRQSSNSVSPNTRQRTRARHAPRSRRHRSTKPQLTSPEPTHQLRVQSLVQFPPLPRVGVLVTDDDFVSACELICSYHFAIVLFPPQVSEDFEVPKPASTATPYRIVLALALPVPPLSATFSSVITRRLPRQYKLVPHLLIARFAANPKARRPSLRRAKRVTLRRQATSRPRSTKAFLKVILPALQATRWSFNPVNTDSR